MNSSTVYVTVQGCTPVFPFSRQTFESDVLAPESSPFCHSPPPESREIANELAHGLLSSIRVCGKCAETQYKTSLNQPKTQMLNAMFSRLYSLLLYVLSAINGLTQPRLSTDRTFLIHIQLGCIAALSIATISAVIRTQSETDTSRVSALAVVDNGRSIMMEDQVTNSAPIALPASKDFFNLLSQCNLFFLAVLRD